MPGGAWRETARCLGETAPVSFGSSRRRPMRAPAVGSVRARACVRCGLWQTAAAAVGQCALCAALRWRVTRACCARVRVGCACASACACLLYTSDAADE